LYINHSICCALKQKSTYWGVCPQALPLISQFQMFFRQTGILQFQMQKVQIKQQNTSLYEKHPPSKFLQPTTRRTKPTKGIGFHQLAGKGLHTHRLFLGLPRRARTRRNLLDFMVQGEIAKADSPTIRLVATPTGLISDHLQQPPIFTPDTFPPQPSQFILVCTPNCLVPSGLVKLCSSALLSRRRSWHPSG